MKSIIKSTFAAATAVFIALSAPAATITLGTSDALGFLFDATPSSPSDEVGYINTLLTQVPLLNTATVVDGRTYTRTNAVAGLPLATTLGATKDESEPPDFTDLTFGTFQYAAAKYANTLYIWYLGALVDYDKITLPGTIDNAVSHISFYNGDRQTRVPDSGATVAFLGMAFAALAFMKRKF